MPITRRDVVIAGAATSLGFPAISVAQSRQMRLGILTPVGHPWNRAALKVADQLNAETKGRLTLTVFQSGQLGNESAMLQQMQSGALDMGWIMASELGSRVPAIAAITAPYVVDTTDKIAKLVRHPVAMKLLTCCQQRLARLVWHGASLECVRSFRRETSTKLLTSKG